MNISLEEIKKRILLLADEHRKNDNLEEDEWEFLENEAENLVINYCVNNNYMINGFPHEKRKIASQLDEEYFNRDRYRLYLDLLSLEKDDVADLMWYFNKTFWPDSFDTKEDYFQVVSIMSDENEL